MKCQCHTSECHPLFLGVGCTKEATAILRFVTVGERALCDECADTYLSIEDLCESYQIQMAKEGNSMMGHWTDEQIMEYEDWLDRCYVDARVQELKHLKKDGPPPYDPDRELRLAALDHRGEP